MFSCVALDHQKMEEFEVQVTKHMKAFCKSLPLHVNSWRTLLEECKRAVIPLCNFSEQLRHVESAKLDYMEDFEMAQRRLQFSILICLEGDLLPLKKHVEQLNKVNYDMYSKLANFEASTISLDFDSDCTIVKGSSVQPSLERLLEMASAYSRYFDTALYIINNCVKTMDVRNERSMANLEESFNVDLDAPEVNELLAITQYIDNEQLIN